MDCRGHQLTFLRILDLAGLLRTRWSPKPPPNRHRKDLVLACRGGAWLRAPLPLDAISGSRRVRDYTSRALARSLTLPLDVRDDPPAPPPLVEATLRCIICQRESRWLVAERWQARGAPREGP